MRWNFMSKALHFLQITAKQQYCPFFTVFLTIKTLSQNIWITLLQISLKLHEHRGCYWRKKLPWMIFEERFPVPRYTDARKIGNSVISLLWQLRCRCNPDHNKFSSSPNTTVVAIFPKLCFWRRSLCSNLGGIDPEKLYQATLRWDKIHFPRSVSACNFCTEINLFVCASFRVFSLNFVGNKLSPWPFFKGTIPIAVRVWARPRHCANPALQLELSL